MRDEVIRWARAAVAVLVLAGLVVAPWVVDDYTTAILARTLALALVGVSVALLTGVAGMPTLGQTAPYAAGAYASAVLGSRISDVGVVQVAVAAGAGAVLAALTVPLVVHARGVIILMITLAIGELVVTVLGRWRSVTGGTDGLAGIPAVRPFWGLPALATDQARYLYTLVVVATLVGAVLLLLRTRAGLLLRAGRDDETRLRASGHRVPLQVSGAHVAAGAIAGAAGSLLVVAQQYISPADFGFDTSALLLLGVVIGGTASVGGALVGAALVIAARDWLFGVLPGQAPLVLGALFVATVYLLPSGVTRARGRLRPVTVPPTHQDAPAAREHATVPELRP
ncbi:MULTISPECIES: branched-chain amino acid ABC transporter permease [unclassified Micromonospora]|uniref:branched-chain amino acid ABC transporter permease n=1 Tax=unclassified Micromonospora TaxID=2617518 RepID=UPI001788A28B|nr:MULTISPECIES: branched-chain amino acid ABC transporter permease [unclassified Micromonospora]MDG4757331.1 branched-chain amino acid ABC transporter permease [Micromonospora sp. WMMD710]